MNIINLGILAHVDAGKTTLTEGLLYHSGAVRQMGNVDRGTTVTDSMPLEQQRGMTIRSSTVSFHWRGTKINLIDTPGHMDFIAEVERVLSVLDGVILVISAKEGVQTQTRVLFHKLRELRIPVLLFLNKADRMGVDLPQMYGQLHTQLTDRFLRMQDLQIGEDGTLSLLPRDLSGDEFLEDLSGLSDRTMERYLDDCALSHEECQQEIRRLTRRGRLFPMFQGSALRDVGLFPLLDAVADYFGHPADANAPLSAYCYKLEWDERRRKRLYFRVFSGTLALRQKEVLLRTGEELTVRNLLAAEDGVFHPTDRILAGDVGILLDATEPRCGDFLGEEYHRRSCREQAQPLLSVHVRPADPGNRNNLLTALKELEEEDPFLSLQLGEQGDISLRLFGKLQVEILQTLLAERYGLRAVFGPASVLYKERPARAAEAAIRISETFYNAGVLLSIEPLPPGSGTEYETEVSYGYLESPFQRAVEEGVRRGLKSGLGSEITDVRVRLLDADYDSVCGTPSDFRELTPQVIQLALEQAGTERLEPWMRFRLEAPTGAQRHILSALHKMRASMQEIRYEPERLVITGTAPFESARDYAVELAAVTEGRGVFELELDRYLPVKS